MRSFPSLVVALVLCAPAVLAEPVPPTPTGVTVVMQGGKALVAWHPIPGATHYTIHGRMSVDDAWTALKNSTLVADEVAGGYGEYGVSAIVDGRSSDVGGSCVTVNPASPNPLAILVLHPPCSVASSGP